MHATHALRRSRGLLAATAALVLALQAVAQAAPRLSPSDVYLLSSYGEAVSLSKARGGGLWPGFRLDQAPMVFYDEGRVAFLVNHPNPPAGFVPFTDRLPVDPGVPVYVRWGDLPSLDHVQDLTVKIKGVPTTLLPYGFLFSNGQVNPKEFWGPAFMSYNQFHDALYPLYQHQNFAWEGEYPTGDAENAALSELEDRALRAALAARTTADTRHAADLFLAVRHARYARLGPEMVRYERVAEGFDGSGRSTKAQFELQGTDPSYRGTAMLTKTHFRWNRPGTAEQEVTRILSNPLDVVALRHARYGATGWAQILLLDRLGQPWKAAIIAGTDSLDGLLARATRYSGSRQNALVAEAKARWNYGQVLAAERAEVKRYPGNLADFNRSAGTRFTIELAPVRNVPGPDPEKAGRDEWLKIVSPAPPLEVDPQTMLAFHVDRFNYRKGATVVQVKDTPLLMSTTDQDWPFQKVTFFAERPDVQVDGRGLALHDGTFPFSTLAVRAPRLVVRASHGTLSVSGNTVVVSHE